jgi:ribonuclease R
LRKQFEPLLPSLEAMASLAQELRRRRMKRGALDFDLPEPEVILNLQGGTEEIIRAERNLAHQVIEEFMMQLMRRWPVYGRRHPSIYRIQNWSRGDGRVQNSFPSGI